MKILIFSDTFFPLIGGAEIYIDNLARYLRKKNHKVIIFTTLILKENQDENESDIIRMNWPSLNIFKLTKFTFSILKLLRDCDLVYAHYSYRLSAVASILAKLKGKAVINFSHGLGTIIAKDDPWRHKLYRFISLKLAKGVITTSNEIGEIAKKFNKNVIVATGVDTEKISRNLDDNEIQNLKKKYKNKKIILTVRRLVPKNGIQYLIETLPFVIKTDKFVKYLIVGDGRMRHALEKRVEELGINDFVEFVGKVENKDVYKFMAIADVVVFPSSAEAMSIACIEAMIVGVPVVATKIGGLVELIGKNNERGVLIDLFGREESLYRAPSTSSISQKKYQEFAEAILRALQDKELVKERVLVTKKFAKENYDWNVITDKILDFSLKKII